MIGPESASDYLLWHLPYTNPVHHSVVGHILRSGGLSPAEKLLSLGPWHVIVSPELEKKTF
jgi:hypothetical protein